MPKLQWEPKINAGHLISAVSMFAVAIGLYYNTQAKIAAEEAARIMDDAAQRRDIVQLQEDRDKMADLIERVNGKTDSVRLDFERHQARGDVR
ncbi:hypothetical protein FJ250_10730 [bacterium]|nr:hypothetical protein [bacterium]